MDDRDPKGTRVQRGLGCCRKASWRWQTLWQTLKQGRIRQVRRGEERALHRGSTPWIWGAWKRQQVSGFLEREITLLIDNYELSICCWPIVVGTEDTRWEHPGHRAMTRALQGSSSQLTRVCKHPPWATGQVQVQQTTQVLRGLMKGKQWQCSVSAEGKVSRSEAEGEGVPHTLRRGRPLRRLF